MTGAAGALAPALHHGGGPGPGARREAAEAGRQRVLLRPGSHAGHIQRGRRPEPLQERCQVGGVGGRECGRRVQGEGGQNG